MLRQFQAGRTYSLVSDFFDDLGNRTPVDNPLIDVFTPFRTRHVTGATMASVAGTTGRYKRDFFVTPGLTLGHWFGLASGITVGLSLFAEPVPFEIIDPTGEEPFWLSVADFRDYIEADDADHTRDGFYKQCLQTSMELIENYTRRQFGLRARNELIEVKHTDRILLKHYPIQTIVGVTATSRIVPRSQTQVVEELTGDTITFHYIADMENAVLRLTDSAGFDESYDEMLVSISYISGFLSIPEPVRQAALSLTSALLNLATTEGIDSIRLSDLSFVMNRNLFEGQIGDLLQSFRKSSF